MGIRVTWGEPVPDGKYTTPRTLTTIEDPRVAKYSDKKLMNGKMWETTTIHKNKPFEITGRFEYRNKIWYEVKSRAKKPQVINHIILLNSLLTPQ